MWTGNVQLLDHEQRSLVQPNFDLLSCAFARLISIGSATSFEVHGALREASYFTSFYFYSLRHRLPRAARPRMWPRITRFDDRWRWLEGCIVPRFRRLDSETGLVATSLRRISHEAREFASMPCAPPWPAH